MPIDRNDTIKRAEKLLRQGRLEAAIAEYTKVVDEYPRDLTTANLLGDLHLRAGQIDRAVAQYTRMAEFLAQDGFVPKAAALYKKILKIKPDHDAALLRMADLAQQQDLVAEARVCLQALYQARVKRGDRDGAADVAVRRAAVDPTDVSGRLDTARLLAELGRTSAAAEQLREAAAVLIGQERYGEGARALAEALRFNPDDEAARDAVVDALVRAGEPERAAEAARTAGQFGRSARAMIAAGLDEAAVVCLNRAVSADPEDRSLRIELARIELARGRAEAALDVLPDGREDDPRDVALLRADLLARSGRSADARAALEGLVTRDAGAAGEAAKLCLSIARTDSAAALACIEPVVDVVRRSGDLLQARSVVQHLVDLSQDPVEALRLMIDVCDDLADEDGVYHGQVRLTDELLAAGHFGEARVLAELLVAKRPDVAQHAERLRAAIDGLGPSAAEMFDAGDGGDGGAGDDLQALLFPGAAAGPSDVQSLSEADFDFSLPEPHPEPAVTPSGEGKPAPADGAHESADVFSLDPLDADLGHVLEIADITPASSDRPETFEVDLSLALNDLLASDRAPEAAAPSSVPGAGQPDAGAGSDTMPGPPEPAARPIDLDGFFQSLREDAGVDERAETASRSFDLASTAYSEGKIQEAREHLERAARDPGFRFRATALLARIERDSGRLREAIEWLERAAEAPAPSAGAWDALLYDLGTTLEAAGETSRALAVFMELQSSSPGYNDVDERIDRLRTSGSVEPGEERER